MSEVVDSPGEVLLEVEVVGGFLLQAEVSS